MTETVQETDDEGRSIGKTLARILIPGTLAIPAIKEFSESIPSQNEDFYFPAITAFMGIYAMVATAVDIGKLGAYAFLAHNLLSKV